MFSIVKVARDQTRPGSLLARLRGWLDERPWKQCRSQSQRVFDTAVLSKPNFLQRVLNALVERIHVDFISGRRVNQGTHAP